MKPVVHRKEPKPERRGDTLKHVVSVWGKGSTDSCTRRFTHGACGPAVRLDISGSSSSSLQRPSLVPPARGPQAALAAIRGAHSPLHSSLSDPRGSAGAGPGQTPRFLTPSHLDLCLSKGERLVLELPRVRVTSEKSQACEEAHAPWVRATLGRPRAWLKRSAPSPPSSRPGRTPSILTLQVWELTAERVWAWAAAARLVRV